VAVITGRRVRVAVVGLGWVATHRHLPALARHGGFEVSGVVDRRPEISKSVAKQLGCRHEATTELSSVSWLEQVDAVIVATSPFTHYAIIRAALERGKHVLTEKPFAMTVPEGEELVALARDRHCVLAIVHNFQFASSTRRLLEDLGRDAIGRIRAVVAIQYGNPERRLPKWYERLPMGLFYDESPHLLYLLRRVSPGPLRLLSCQTFPSTSGKVTPAYIQVQYAGERKGEPATPVTLTMHFESPISEWHLAVLGDHSLGAVDVFRDIYMKLPNDGRHSTREVVRTSATITWSHWRQHMKNGPLHLTGRLLYGNDEVYKRFYASITEQVEPTGIAAEDALAVLRMQHEILRSATPLV
jgi:predicted dehydrogenase